MAMMKLMGTALCCGLFLLAGAAVAEDASEADSVPAPGKQVLQKIKVPAGKEAWSTGNVDQLGEYIPADSATEQDLFYWLFIPADESAKSENGYPLILFLHGSGERGNPEAVPVHGPPKIVKTEKGAAWPFITVSPCCQADGYWSPDQLLVLLDEIIKTQPVDTDRIYVTGLSMGGYGTWMLLDKAGDRFAAAAPICGGCDPAKASKMLDYPIWIFHGGSDGVVPTQRSIDMQAAIKTLGGEKSKLTIYPGCDHDSWTRTYSNPELYKWFLSHKLSDRR